MVTTAWRRFHEHRDNGLVSDVFKDQTLMNRLKGAPLHLTVFSTSAWSAQVPC